MLERVQGDFWSWKFMRPVKWSEWRERWRNCVRNWVMCCGMSNANLARLRILLFNSCRRWGKVSELAKRVMGACTGGIRVRHQEQGTQALRIQCESRCAVTNRSYLRSGRSGVFGRIILCPPADRPDGSNRELHCVARFKNVSGINITHRPHQRTSLQPYHSGNGKSCIIVQLKCLLMQGLV